MVTEGASMMAGESWRPAAKQEGERTRPSSINVKQTESTGSGVYCGFQEEHNIIYL